MKNPVQGKIKDTVCLTLGDTTYKTSGNITFACENGGYYLAESELLDKVDHAIENGILSNGMLSFMRKLKKG